MKIFLIVPSLLTSQLWAATQTSNFTVTATVNANCTIVTNNLDFGNYLGAQIDASTTMTINCTNGTPYTVALNIGTGSGATYANRILTSGASTMNYNLFTDTVRTTVWGDGTSSSQLNNGTGSGTNQTLTVYGRLPGSQTPTSGTYTDTVTATVTY
ncbi:MAG: spore coat U domain-containing protein [Candidatus Paracaedibacteraceae bacterium]|nr:spore coat U domain-containing protein [Candidatus Paracaedibacteraceae bacterium]